MNTCVLERQAIDSSEIPAVPDKVSDFRLPLAEKLKKIGYSFFWDTLNAPRLIVELRKTLQILDKQPFSSASVESYQKQMKKIANRKANLVRAIGLILIIPTVFSLIGMIQQIVIVANGNVFADNGKLFLLYTSGFVVFAFACGIILGISSEMRWNWRKVELSEYRRPIPEFVLETARRISDCMPDAKFWIEELKQNKKVKDPFLIVGAGTSDTMQETYYIEVFKEPLFEKDMG